MDRIDYRHFVIPYLPDVKDRKVAGLSIEQWMRFMVYPSSPEPDLINDPFWAKSERIQDHQVDMILSLTVRALFSVLSGHMSVEDSLKERDIALANVQHSFHDSLLQDETAALLRWMKEQFNAVEEESRSVNYQAVIRYIDDHLDTSLSPSEISHKTGLSMNYVTATFPKFVGKSLSAFIRSRRIDTAKNMLALTRFPVEQIAAALGYAHSPSFIRAFQKETGLTPLKFRKNNAVDLSTRWLLNAFLPHWNDQELSGKGKRTP